MKGSGSTNLAFIKPNRKMTCSNPDTFRLCTGDIFSPPWGYRRADLPLMSDLEAIFEHGLFSSRGYTRGFTVFQ